MERSKLILTALAGLFAVFCLMAAGVEVGNAGEEDSPVDMNCTSIEGVACSKSCGPAKMNVLVSGGNEVITMAERRQANLLSGKSVMFQAQCPMGYGAIGGGYRVIEDGTTIDLDEVQVSSSIADNNPFSNWFGWKVGVFRNASGAPENCLNIEVQAYCMRGAMGNM